jgi:RNA polymerase sigma-70 factor (ECF subfamily)
MDVLGSSGRKRLTGARGFSPPFFCRTDIVRSFLGCLTRDFSGEVVMKSEETRRQNGDSDSLCLLIDEAHHDSEALGQLLDGCRQYLLLVANQELDATLRKKVGASDLVQDTFLDAQRDFKKFQGTTEADLLVWLRQILLNNLGDARRRYFGTTKRRLSREIDLSQADNSRSIAIRAPVDRRSPSWFAMRREEAEAIGQSLDRLSDDHRRVIVLRNLELRPFSEIAVLMDRSEAAVRKLWARAIQSLTREMEGDRDG